ncbi:MAG: hypothetical protein WC437_04790 [Patescibacteria group bacterium]
MKKIIVETRQRKNSLIPLMSFYVENTDTDKYLVFQTNGTRLELKGKNIDRVIGLLNQKNNYKGQK